MIIIDISDDKNTSYLVSSLWNDSPHEQRHEETTPRDNQWNDGNVLLSHKINNDVIKDVQNEIIPR